MKALIYWITSTLVLIQWTQPVPAPLDELKINIRIDDGPDQSAPQRHPPTGQLQPPLRQPLQASEYGGYKKYRGYKKDGGYKKYRGYKKDGGYKKYRFNKYASKKYGRNKYGRKASHYGGYKKYRGYKKDGGYKKYRFNKYATKKYERNKYGRKGGCIKEDNFAYWGESIVSGITRNGEEQCANWCGKKYNCKLWILQKSNNLCLLKTHNYDRRQNYEYISGSKGCAKDTASVTSPTPTPASTPRPTPQPSVTSPTPTPSPTTTPTSVSTPRPTPQPSVTSPTPTPSPTTTPIPASTPRPRPQPSVTSPSPTTTPIPSSTPAPTPQPLVTSPIPTPLSTTIPIPTSTPAPTPQSSGFAENVEGLSSARITSLTEAMRRLHASPDWERVTSQHGEPVRRECGFNLCCIHGGLGGFLPWHRAYMDSFNSALGTVLPYWDWTTSCFPSIAHSAPFFRGLQVYDDNYTNRSSECVSTEGNLNTILRALEEDDFLLFSIQLQDIHDTIHINIGGSMDILGAASYDPIFFFHHTFVDLVWAVYNVLKPNILPPNLGQRLIPFGRTINQTLSTNRYNLDINSNRMVFGGMTLAQIKNRIFRRTESGVEGFDRIYAGFFKRSYSTSGIIKFNICNKDDCSYPGGKVSILGGRNQMSYINSDPTKVDITDAVNKAGMFNIKQLKIKITSFTKVNGRPINKTIYAPIRIVRPGNGGRNLYNSGRNDGYCIFFNRYNIQPPKMRIPKNTLLEIDSPYQNVIETKNRNSYIKCNKSDGIPQKSKRPINVKPGIYYFFDDNCKPQPSNAHNEQTRGNANAMISRSQTMIENYVSKLQIVKE